MIPTRNKLLGLRKKKRANNEEKQKEDEYKSNEQLIRQQIPENVIYDNKIIIVKKGKRGIQFNLWKNTTNDRQIEINNNFNFFNNTWYHIVWSISTNGTWNIFINNIA